MLRRLLKIASITVLAVAALYSALISVPVIISIKLAYDEQQTQERMQKQFPVTVDMRNKRIIEDPEIEKYFENHTLPFQASVWNAGEVFWEVIGQAAGALTASALYQNVAAVAGRVVVINPGMRKEQVANAFGTALGWTEEEKREFLAPTPDTIFPAPSPIPTLAEGVFSPGTYVVDIDTTPSTARALVNERFTEEILSRYSEEVNDAVPIRDALTIASLIQREAAGAHDMRIVSGVIWNRLFNDMRLQIDATVQYARANLVAGGVWWPAARPTDLSIRSPYNTYRQPGLPPGPIANPSVAAVLAALNPVATDCFFYFHDQLRQIHCSKDYAGHVALLKQHFGRGK